VRRCSAQARWAGSRCDGEGTTSYSVTTARAIRCACAITEAVTELGLEVRAGLHTGECELIDGKIAGIAVHTGARVAAKANPGEVLVSRTVKDLVAGSGLAFETAERMNSRASRANGDSTQSSTDAAPATLHSGDIPEHWPRGTICSLARVLVLSGYGLGLFLAAQVGPVTLLIVRSVLRGGRAVAVGLAMAAAVAAIDLAYAIVGLAGMGWCWTRDRHVSGSGR
jgi:hypothetical protein